MSMSQKTFITEDEKFRILNLHGSSTTRNIVISEALGGPALSSIERLKAKFPNGYNFAYNIVSNGSTTFANGVDTINPNDPKIKDIIQTIKDLLKATKGKVSVVVGGGASAVGSTSGYDNNALAARIRDNLIAYIKQNITDSRVVITPGTTKVGKATVMNSPEAVKEQYVSAAITGEQNLNLPIQGVAGDNTNVDRRDLFRNVPKGKVKKKKICLTIPTSFYNSFKNHMNQMAKETKNKITWTQKDV
jgi:hypothetical protein